MHKCSNPENMVERIGERKYKYNYNNIIQIGESSKRFKRQSIKGCAKKGRKKSSPNRAIETPADQAARNAKKSEIGCTEGVQATEEVLCDRMLRYVCMFLTNVVFPLNAGFFYRISCGTIFLRHDIYVSYGIFCGTIFSWNIFIYFDSCSAQRN